MMLARSADLTWAHICKHVGHYTTICDVSESVTGVGVTPVQQLIYKVLHLSPTIEYTVQYFRSFILLFF